MWVIGVMKYLGMNYMDENESNSNMSLMEFVSLLPSSVFERAYELYFIEYERMKIENLRIIMDNLK